MQLSRCRSTAAPTFDSARSLALWCSSDQPLFSRIKDEAGRLQHGASQSFGRARAGEALAQALQFAARLLACGRDAVELRVDALKLLLGFVAVAGGAEGAREADAGVDAGRIQTKRFGE